MRKRQVPLYEVIGKEVINEIITVGFSFLIIMFGVSYFNFKYAWVKIISILGEQSGLSQSEFSNELSLMFSSLGQSFPLKYLFTDYNISQATIIGLAILSVGLILKFLLKVSKEKFIIDIGRNIYVPAIVGFLSVITIQVILGVTAQNNYSEFTNQLDSSLFIWNTYGQLFLVGINALLVGSVLKIISKRQKSMKMVRISNVILNSSYISLVYYLIMRFLSLEAILNSNLGSFFKIFIISGDVTAYVILFCIFTFSLGLEINKHGKFLLQQLDRKKRESHQERINKLMSL